jgi:GDP/UDP-N,N'-diacetylbacillosamine 2-epimerase (hydrolysing)
MSRKICVVSTTRAEFGLLKRLMTSIDLHPDLILQVVVGGMHLSAEFGLTYREVEDAGFTIDAKVDMLISSDSSSAVSKSMGIGMLGFSDVYNRLSPDLVVVLGDRFDIFSAVVCAMIAVIPIAHLHGGETTEGAFDEAIRHSITKMSHLHFTATEEYRRRVIQLGEDPRRTYNVGGMGVDSIKNTSLMTKVDLEESLGIMFGDKNLLITYHPETLEGINKSAEQLGALLGALNQLDDVMLIFTMPNADTGGRALANMVDEFVANHQNSVVFTSLGQLRYLSCLAQVDAVVGNSSSGLLEAPTFRIGTINIGNRQKGRLVADSVINCQANEKSILSAVNMLYTAEFQERLPNIQSPYDSGDGVDQIIDVLATADLSGICKKEFYDL